MAEIQALFDLDLSCEPQNKAGRKITALMESWKNDKKIMDEIENELILRKTKSKIVFELLKHCNSWQNIKIVYLNYIRIQNHVRERE